MNNVESLSPESMGAVEERSGNSGLFKFAWVLRHLGVFSVGIAALIFMLQGIEDVSPAYRQWTWLLLMLAMSGAGVLCRNMFDNVKSARILFSLAAAVVPVQFSQLGGMVWQYFSNDVVTSGIAAVTALSPVWLALDVVISAGLAFVISLTCFSILVRRSSKTLAFIFTLMSMTMVLPFRENAIAWVTVLSMLITLVVLEYRLFSRYIEFKTAQSYVLRVVLMLPLVITLIRNALHFDESASIFVMFGLVSMLMTYGVAHSLRGHILREGILMLGGGLGIFSWLQFAHHCNIDSFFLTSIISVAILAELARLSDRWRNAYIKVASTVGVLLALIVCLDNASLIESILLLMLSAVAITLGLIQQRYAPLIAGVIIGLISLSILVVTSIESVSINIWLSLALAGGGLVLGSAAVEKYASKCSSVWQTVKQFD